MLSTLTFAMVACMFVPFVMEKGKMLLGLVKGLLAKVTG